MTTGQADPAPERWPQPLECEPDLDSAARGGEWIDPEGDDWLSWIYGELSGARDGWSSEGPRAEIGPTILPELASWFG